MRHKINNKGFTLMELMVVVAIAGVMAAIAVPSYINYLPHLRLNAAARDLASDLRLARQLAVSRNTSYTVNFISSTQYRIETGGTVLKTVDVRNVTIDPGSAPAVAIDPVADPQFSPFGTTTAQIAVGLTSDTGEARTVTILTTGSVRIQ